jgi:hypothetical protein
MNPSQVHGMWYLRVTADGATATYAGVLAGMMPMTIRSGSCAFPDPPLAIPQIKPLSDLTVTLDVEITKP